MLRPMPDAQTPRRIEYVPLDDVVPADRNPKEHAIPDIVTSVRRFGFTAPLLHDERTDRLVAGHGRLDALRAIRDSDDPKVPNGITLGPDGAWLVPVVRGWASTDDAHAEAYLVADNRLTERGGWDDHALAALLEDVRDYSPDLLAATGFSGDDLDALLASVTGDDAGGGREPLNDPDEVPEAPDEPTCRPGDVWVLGAHRLAVGDSTDPAVHAALLRGEQVDCVWTDPPYGVAYVGKTKDALTIENDALDLAGLTEFLRKSLGAAKDDTRPGAAWYVAAPHGPMGHAFGTVLTDLGVWKHSLVWVKDVFVMGRSDYHYRHEALFYGWTPGAPRLHPLEDRTQDTVWEIPRPKRSEEHPTMKPVALVVKALENSSAPGERVLDLFAGSGTTLIACEDTGRAARCIELDPTYADVIVQRWVNHTGGQPVREADGATWASVKT